MAIYEINTDQIRRISETSFGAAGIDERTHLQRLLRGHIDVICSDETLVIAEEFCEWEDTVRDEANWPTLQTKMVDTMVRFEKALRPNLERLG